MENEINTPSQLDELQAKYDILKRKFDAQQIVNHDLVQQVAQNKMGALRRKQRNNLYWSIPISLFCWIWVTFKMDASFALSMAFLAIMLYSNIRYAVLMRKVLKKTTTTEDLLDAARSCKESYNVSNIYRMISIPLCIVMLVWFMLELQHISLAELTWQSLDKTMLFIMVFTFAFSLVYSRKQKTKDTAICDEIIKSLTEE